MLYAWYGGQEVGHAVGDLLFGVAVPSGKSPVTFPRRIEDSTAYGHYPGENLHVEYAEGIFVGYRGFDKRKVEPLFPFGHGLSYTTFEYSGLKVSSPDGEGGRDGRGQHAGPQQRTPRRGRGGPALPARRGVEPASPGEGAEGIPPRDLQPGQTRR